MKKIHLAFLAIAAFSISSASGAMQMGRITVHDAFLVAQNDEQDPFLKSNQQEKEKYRKEQQQLRGSWTENESEYYRETAPHEVDDPDYFEKSHPLEENPLDESLLK